MRILCSFLAKNSKGHGRKILSTPSFRYEKRIKPMFATRCFGQNWGQVCGYGDKGHESPTFLHETCILAKLAMFFNDIYGAAVKDTDLRRYLSNVGHMFRVKTSLPHGIYWWIWWRTRRERGSVA